jgi:hypothetical protein
MGRADVSNGRPASVSWCFTGTVGPAEMVGLIVSIWMSSNKMTLCEELRKMACKSRPHHLLQNSISISTTESVRSTPYKIWLPRFRRHISAKWAIKNGVSPEGTVKKEIFNAPINPSADRCASSLTSESQVPNSEIMFCKLPVQRGKRRTPACGVHSTLSRPPTPLISSRRQKMPPDTLRFCCSLLRLLVKVGPCLEARMDTVLESVRPP